MPSTSPPTSKTRPTFEYPGYWGNSVPVFGKASRDAPSVPGLINETSVSTRTSKEPGRGTSKVSISTEPGEVKTTRLPFKTSLRFDFPPLARLVRGPVVYSLSYIDTSSLDGRLPAWLATCFLVLEWYCPFLNSDRIA